MESHSPPFQQDFLTRWKMSAVMMHEGIALLSGVTARRADGTYAATGAEQAADVFDILARVLEHAGLSFADVLEMTSYHTDIADLDGFRAVRDTYVVEPWPAWTAVGVTALATPTALVEVRLTCRTNPSSQKVGATSPPT